MPASSVDRRALSFIDSTSVTGIAPYKVHEPYKVQTDQWQKTPLTDLKVARERKKEVENG